jgi:hypothetical protein
VALRKSSHLVRYDPAFSQQEQSGHSLHSQPGRDVRRLVHIHLHHLEPAGEFLRGPLDCGSHHPAGAAPGGPQVDQHWKPAVRGRVEVCVGGFDQPGQIRVAGGASRCAPGGTRDPITDAARGAADYIRCHSLAAISEYQPCTRFTANSLVPADE